MSSISVRMGRDSVRGLRPGDLLSPVRFWRHQCNGGDRLLHRLQLRRHVSPSQKRKCRQVDCPGRHWGRWSLSSTSPVTRARAVNLTTFCFSVCICLRRSIIRKPSLLFWMITFIFVETYWTTILNRHYMKLDSNPLHMELINDT